MRTAYATHATVPREWRILTLTSLVVKKVKTCGLSRERRDAQTSNKSKQINLKTAGAHASRLDRRRTRQDRTQTAGAAVAARPPPPGARLPLTNSSDCVELFDNSVISSLSTKSRVYLSESSLSTCFAATDFCFATSCLACQRRSMRWRCASLIHRSDRYSATGLYQGAACQRDSPAWTCASRLSVTSMVLPPEVW